MIKLENPTGKYAPAGNQISYYIKTLNVALPLSDGEAAFLFLS